MSRRSLAPAPAKDGDPPELSTRGGHISVETVGADRDLVGPSECPPRRAAQDPATNEAAARARQTSEPLAGAAAQQRQAIPVKAGQFRKQLSDRYHEERTSIVERFQIQGRIDGARAVGQFTVEVRARRPDGSGYACNVGPIPFTAVN